MKRILLILLAITISVSSYSQIDEDKTGAWYMYFFNAGFGESNFGIQGDIQYRNWNIAGDLEQLLLRGGFYYRPEGSSARFTLGFGNITTGEMGESTETVLENRIYQEALLPHNPLERIYLTHRFRYEQRFVENQDFRTRYRYTLFMNIPFNKAAVEKNSVYLALYNEIFINGQREIGDGREVEIFDRNRTYLGLGYGITANMRVQAGWMRQITDNWAKNQLQFSLHHKIN
jgi:hypothetical protein